MRNLGRRDRRSAHHNLFRPGWLQAQSDWTFARLRPGADIRADRAHRDFRGSEKLDRARRREGCHLTYLGDATIGRRANIGAGTITCNYDGVAKHPHSVGDRGVHRKRHRAGCARSHLEPVRICRRIHDYRECPCRCAGHRARTAIKQAKLGLCSTGVSCEKIAKRKTTSCEAKSPKKRRGKRSSRSTPSFLPREAPA